MVLLWLILSLKHLIRPGDHQDPALVQANQARQLLPLLAKQRKLPAVPKPKLNIKTRTIIAKHGPGVVVSRGG